MIHIITQACLKLQDSQSIVLIVVMPIQRYFGHNQIIIYLTAMYGQCFSVPKKLQRGYTQSSYYKKILTLQILQQLRLHHMWLFPHMFGFYHTCVVKSTQHSYHECCFQVCVFAHTCGINHICVAKPNKQVFGFSHTCVVKDTHGLISP